MPDETRFTPRYAVYPLQEAVSTEELADEAAAGLTIPLWSATARYKSQSFKYTMVGQNPQIKLKNPATTIPFVIVPVRFTFANGDVFDPTARDPVCSPAGTPLELFLNSPILKNVTPTNGGGGKIVTGQYAGVFQFSNFYKFTGASGGLNPHFSVTLQPTVQNVLPITVSKTGGTVVTATCGNLGIISASAWQSFVQATIFKQLKSTLKPTTIPFFLFYNVVMSETGGTGGCCVLGSHAAFLNPNYARTFQAYAVADYDTSQEFTGVSDTSATSHETNELQDDPNGLNPTPSWGHVGQVAGCQSDLEVGDPLSGTLFPVTMANGFTYHVQDLAFISWFYRQSPSIGVGGTYSLLGTFTTSAGPICH